MKACQIPRLHHVFVIRKPPLCPRLPPRGQAGWVAVLSLSGLCLAQNWVGNVGVSQATQEGFEQHQELWRVFMARWGSCPCSFPCSYVIQVFLWIWETPVVILGWLDERASNQASPAQRAGISISTFISGCLTRDTMPNNSDRSESGGGSEVAITLT